MVTSEQINKLIGIYKYNEIYTIKKGSMPETGDFIIIKFEYGEHFIPINDIKDIEIYHSDSVSIQFVNGGHFFIAYDKPFTSLSY